MFSLAKSSCDLIIKVFVGLCLTTMTWADESLSEEVKALRALIRELQTTCQQLQQLTQKQQQQIDQLIARQEAGITPEPAAASLPQPPGFWNPELGGNLDLVYIPGSSKLNLKDDNRVQVREFEMVIGSALDPYSRVDLLVAYSEDEGAALEEAYYTHYALPGKLTARLGKFKPRFGKALAIHRDQLETVDAPLVIQRYFGSEGFNRAGLELTRILDLDWPVTHLVNFGVLEGGNNEDGRLFGDAKRRPTLYSQLTNSIDIGDDTGLDLGLSLLAGSRDDDERFETHVGAGQLSLVHHFNARQGLRWQSEIFNVNRAETIGARDNVWGMYSLVELRLNPRWFIGSRVDYVELIDNHADPGNEDRGVSAFLTFYQSEYVRWRAQYSHTRLADGTDDNTVYLQGNLAFGSHKHKIKN